MLVTRLGVTVEWSQAKLTRQLRVSVTGETCTLSIQRFDREAIILGLNQALFSSVQIKMVFLHLKLPQGPLAGKGFWVGHWTGLVVTHFNCTAVHITSMGLFINLWHFPDTLSPDITMFAARGQDLVRCQLQVQLLML